MKVFLTGATGMLGRATGSALLAGGHHLTPLARDPRRLPPAWAGRCTPQVGDLQDVERLSHQMQGHEVVVHMAGLVSFWPPDRAQLWRVNVEGTAVAVAAAQRAGVRRFIHTSSIAALGYHADPDAIGDESTPFNWPRGFAYFHSKRAAEAQVEQAQGLERVILNPGALIGPGDVNGHTDRLYANALQGWFCPIGATTVTPLIEAVQAHLQALQADIDGQRLIIGAHPLSFADLFGLIGDVSARSGGHPPPRHRPAPLFLSALFGWMAEVRAAWGGRAPHHSRELAIITSRNRRFMGHKAQALLGLTPTSLSEAIAQALADRRKPQQTSPQPA